MNSSKTTTRKRYYFIPNNHASKVDVEQLKSFFVPKQPLEEQLKHFTGKYSDFICKIYKQFLQFGITPQAIDVDEEKKSLEIFYLLTGRNVFNYDELEALQNIVNPSIEHHDSIRVTKECNECTMRIDLSR